MGCAFDIFSSSWTDRAYFIFSFCLCYLIPLCIIIFSYWKIVSYSRSSYRDILSRATIFRGKSVQLTSPGKIASISGEQGFPFRSMTKRKCLVSNVSQTNLLDLPLYYGIGNYKESFILNLKQLDTEVRLSKTVGMILLVWILAWTPYAVMATWTMFFDAYGLTHYLGLIPLITCKISASFNVLFYGLRFIIVMI